MADIRFVIEIWDPRRRKYEECWSGASADRAETMMNKPYYQRHTRRLWRITREVLYQEEKATK